MRVLAKILIFSFLINSAFANSIKIKITNSNVTNSLAKELSDTPYVFDKNKLKDAQDSFHFLRTFVDYFYLITKSNLEILPTIQNLSSINGWCVGDAHPENFGVILKANNTQIFTHNDMDDSGPAPVIYDLYRLLVSSSLYDPSIDFHKMFQSYVAGLSQSNYALPRPVQEMFQKSQKNGLLPSKNKIENQKFVRTIEMTELSASDLTLLLSLIKKLKGELNLNAFLIDAVELKKVGGGSGGMLRYELLINNGGNLLHLELKSQKIPSIYPVATTIPPLVERIGQTIKTIQGINPSSFYKVINFNSQMMLLRPKFSGNIGVSLDKYSLIDNQDIIYYESYILGTIHSRSIVNAKNWINTLKNTQFNDLEKDVLLMTDFFNKKFIFLKK